MSLGMVEGERAKSRSFQCSVGFLQGTQVSTLLQGTQDPQLSKPRVAWPQDLGTSGCQLSSQKPISRWDQGGASEPGWLLHPSKAYLPDWSFLFHLIKTGLEVIGLLGDSPYGHVWGGCSSQSVDLAEGGNARGREDGCCTGAVSPQDSSRSCKWARWSPSCSGSVSKGWAETPNPSTH